MSILSMLTSLYYCGALHSQGEITQNNTIRTVLCSDGHNKLFHVIMLSAVLTAAWYMDYSYIICTLCIAESSESMHLVLCNMYNFNLFVRHS